MAEWLLLGEHHCYGVDRNSLKWFESYISNRRQTFCVNDKLSNVYSIKFWRKSVTILSICKRLAELLEHGISKNVC